MPKVVPIDVAKRLQESREDALALLDAAAEAAVEGKMAMREFVEQAECQWSIHFARDFTERMKREEREEREP